MDKQVGKSDSSASIFSTQGGRTEPNAIEVPKIELPKGGKPLQGAPKPNGHIVQDGVEAANRRRQCVSVTI